MTFFLSPDYLISVFVVQEAFAHFFEGGGCLCVYRLEKKGHLKHHFLSRKKKKSQLLQYSSKNPYDHLKDLYMNSGFRLVLESFSCIYHSVCNI